LGDLRFRRSVPPLSQNKIIDNGSSERICPQAIPAWMKAPVISTPSTPFSNSSARQALPLVRSSQTGSDSIESEDCLLLDVMVPKVVFDAAQDARAQNTKNLKPVLVWIHGGGFVHGSKSSSNPAGLLAKSVAGGRPGIVYVQMNYRL
jgi:carboxylesterase type B